MTNRTPRDRLRTLRLLGALAGLSAALGACTYTGAEVVTASVSDDYRLRHPIAVQEADTSIVVFVGQSRGGLSAAQRADVTGLARTWVREGTGAIVIDVPVDTPNARPRRRPRAKFRRRWRRVACRHAASGCIATIRTTRDARDHQAELSEDPAVAGPCGLWPEDLGPSVLNPGYSENRPYHNFGCAHQRNLAAMIDNPADLEQPRSETAAYTARRTEAFEKYRKGTSTTTTYPESDKAKLSDTGK